MLSRIEFENKKCINNEQSNDTNRVALPPYSSPCNVNNAIDTTQQISQENI